MKVCGGKSGSDPPILHLGTCWRCHQLCTRTALPERKQPDRLRLKCDGTCGGTRFRLSVKRTSPFKSAGASVQSTTGSRGVRISGSNARYTMFRGSVNSTGYPLYSPVSPSLPLPCVTVCLHTSTALYLPNMTPSELQNGTLRTLNGRHLD
jgi:hypothetical protein